MAQPETREVLQCVYAPRMAAETPTGGRSAESEEPAPEPVVQNNVLLKSSILTTALANAAATETLLATITKPNSTQANIVEAVRALNRGDYETAGQHLSPVSVDQVAEFAQNVLAEEEKLVKVSTKAIAKWIEPKKKSDAGKKDSKSEQATMTGGSLLDGMQQASINPLFAQTLAQENVPAYEYMRAINAIGAAEPTLGTTINPDALRWSATVDVIIDSIRQRLTAIEELRRSAAVDPVGFLHLQRLQFTPVGYRRGDLMHSITMLPGETVRFTHREWSRTEREFTDLVVSTMENETEEAVSEKSEITESTSSQQTHQMAFSASLSASGGFGFMSIAANAGFQLNQQTSLTSQFSSRRSRELTRRATSRAKQEHKVSIRTFSAAETETTNYRELTNTSDDAIRWDFHRMIREWHVELFQYGLRLTYDLTVPEPGSYLLRHYVELDRLQDAIDRGPANPPPISVLTHDNWQRARDLYGVALEPPPLPKEIRASQSVTYPGQDNSFTAATVDLIIPDGYFITADATIDDPPINAKRDDEIQTSFTDMRRIQNRARLAGTGVTGMFPWQFTVHWHDGPKPNSNAVASVRATASPLQTTVEQWRTKNYALIVDALRSRDEARLAGFARRRDELRNKLNAFGTLDLRRVEREEIMKSVLRWMLGPNFRFYPSDMPRNLLQAQAGLRSDLDSGPSEDFPGLYSADTGAVVSEAVQNAALRQGRLITFIHQAIEWENVNFILYPYFWSDPQRWHMKQFLQHADDQHWQFLRAGAARVVLTVRRGFEATWLRLADTGQLGDVDPNTPYVRIADQIKAVAATYDGRFSPRQPHDPGVSLDEWTEWTPTGALDVVRGEILRE